MIGILVITHGKFGEEMLKSAESILGPQENTRFIHLPTGETIDILVNKLETTIKEIDQGEGVLILTDMLGGTPCNICLKVSKTNINIEIVSGLNLYMLLTAFVQRSKIGLKELVTKVIESGRKNITNIKEIFLK